MSYVKTYNTSMNILRTFKHLCIRTGILPRPGVRRVLSGPNSGIAFHLDLSSEFQFYSGLAEVENHRWIVKLCGGISTAADVGAAYGEQTLFLVKKTGAKKVFAVEPGTLLNAKLKENLRLNDLLAGDRVEIISKFVGDESKGCLSLDVLLKEQPEPIFIKMDIEGMEVEALKSSAKTLDRSDVRWLIEVHSRELESAAIQIFRNCGYQVQVIPQAFWRCFLPENRTKDNRWIACYKPDSFKSEKSSV